jgi:hypothetical protein
VDTKKIESATRLFATVTAFELLSELGPYELNQAALVLGHEKFFQIPLQPCPPISFKPGSHGLKRFFLIAEDGFFVDEVCHLLVCCRISIFTGRP